MQANLLKGTQVRQSHPNNNGPDSSKNKNYTFKQNLSFSFFLLFFFLLLAIFRHNTVK